MSRRLRLIVLSGLGLAVLGPAAAWTYTLLQPVRHWLSVPANICVVGPGHVSISGGDADGGVTAVIEALNGTHTQLPGTGWNGVVGPVLHASSCSTPPKSSLDPPVPCNAMTTGRRPCESARFNMIPGTRCSLSDAKLKCAPVIPWIFIG